MPDDEQPPFARRVQMRAMPAIFRAVNVPMRFVLGLPVATPLGKRLMLVYLTGRKSGRRYRQPVSYVSDGDALLTPGGGRWKLNLVEGEPTRLRLRGQDISVRPELVDDPSEVDRLLKVMSAKNPMLARFVPIPKTNEGDYDRERLNQAIKHGFRIVRWRPDGLTANQVPVT